MGYPYFWKHPLLPWSKCVGMPASARIELVWAWILPTFSWRKACKAIYRGYISIYNDLRGRPCTILFNWDIAPFWLLQLASLNHLFGVTLQLHRHHTRVSLQWETSIDCSIYTQTRFCKTPFQVSSYMDVSKKSGFSPQIIFLNRVFHYFHHPFWSTIVPLFLVQHPFWGLSQKSYLLFTRISRLATSQMPGACGRWVSMASFDDGLPIGWCSTTSRSHWCSLPRPGWWTVGKGDPQSPS